MKNKIKIKYEEMKKLHEEAIAKFWDNFDKMSLKAYAGKLKKKK